ncbi:hypothetical protein ACFQVD_44770 [Streptosporangium amethystogenes subsp. fukuiense]|uniref:Uncharacterized protein n=2 Tax=Streptosporangium amethystogenes TaxID=2002 RepID=A0ABW2TGA2_9ACTN
MNISSHTITTTDLVWSAISAGLGLTVGVVIGIVIGVHLARGNMVRQAHPAPVPPAPAPYPSLSGAVVVREIIREVPAGPALYPGVPAGPASIVRPARPEVTR